LTLVDQHIAQAEKRLTQQLQRIERMEANGHDTSSARAMLRVMRLGLALARERRQQIAAKLSDE
jgi:hypothetical protein